MLFEVNEKHLIMNTKIRLRGFVTTQPADEHILGKINQKRKRQKSRECTRSHVVSRQPPY